MIELKMVEIYGGNDDRWAGWHNLILEIDGNAGNSKPIQGPIDPETSKQIKEALKNEFNKGFASAIQAKSNE